MSEEHIVWLIEWEDSCSSDSWIHASRLDDWDEFRCFTVGRIVRETKRSIIIASSWLKTGGESYCGIIVIPRRAILRKIEAIRKPEEWWTQQERGRKARRGEGA